MGEERGVHRVLVGKPERKRPLGRPRLRWEDNIKIDLQEETCCPTDESLNISIKTFSWYNTVL
jgi:hypothetical protein